MLVHNLDICTFTPLCGILAHHHVLRQACPSCSRNSHCHSSISTSLLLPPPHHKDNPLAPIIMPPTPTPSPESYTYLHSLVLPLLIYLALPAFVILIFGSTFYLLKLYRFRRQQARAKNLKTQEGYIADSSLWKGVKTPEVKRPEPTFRRPRPLTVGHPRPKTAGNPRPMGEAVVGRDELRDGSGVGDAESCWDGSTVVGGGESSPGLIRNTSESAGGRNSTAVPGRKTAVNK